MLKGGKRERELELRSLEKTQMEAARHTCLKLQIPNKPEPESIFVKGTWFSTHFQLSITDGLNAWTCNASEDEVRDRAASWDQPVSEYIELTERYLGFQQPNSIYGFADAGSGQKRLSWTFEREGTKLEWRWKCQPSLESKTTTANMLDFLMDANIRLSEEVVIKTCSNERLKMEAEKCLTQSEKFNTEKQEFETAIYSKFLGVLNSKKAKLRELRDRLSKKSGKEPEEEEVDEGESTDKTETFNGDSDDDGESEGESTKNVPVSRPRGRKRK